MKQYKITMKNGAVLIAESKWLDLLSICSSLNEHQPFIVIGCVVLSKTEIASIEKIEETPTEEKEN